MIRADHLAVRSTFHKYRLDASPDKKRAIGETIATAVVIHARLEEGIFYPAIRKADEDHGQHGNSLGTWRASASRGRRLGLSAARRCERRVAARYNPASTLHPAPDRVRLPRRRRARSMSRRRPSVPSRQVRARAPQVSSV